MSKDPFENLEIKLKELEYPQVYLFKFICKSENQLIARVTSMFNDENKLTMKPSKNGKYTSISVKETMLSSDEIMKVYREAAKITGVIIL